MPLESKMGGGVRLDLLHHPSVPFVSILPQTKLATTNITAQYESSHYVS